MKKLFCILALSIINFSCSNEELKTNETTDVLNYRDGRPVLPTEKQKEEAVLETNTEVYNLVAIPRYKPKNSVVFCGDPNFTGSSGGGFAKVTLADNTVHYTSYSWFKDSTGEIIVGGKYEGTSPPAGSGC